MKSISRRDLIRKGSVAAATTFTIVAPQAVRGSQANSKISVGLIGSGGRGTYDAGIFHSDSRARVTALCDLFQDRTESAASEAQTGIAGHLHRLRKAAGVGCDAVVIATPPFEHPSDAGGGGPVAQAHLLREAYGRGSRRSEASIAAGARSRTRRKTWQSASSSATARCTWRLISV